MEFVNTNINQKQIKQKAGSILLILILICSGLVAITSSTQNFNNATAESTWSQKTAKNFKNGTLDNLTAVGSGEDAELKINLSGLHTWTKTQQTVKPLGGYYHEMASIWGDDKIMLFGGYGYYNTTFEYDLSNETWTKKNILTNPEARYWQGMASVWGDDKVVLYGGLTTAGYVQDTWVYDSSDSTWTEKNPSGSLPYSTSTHNMATIWGTKKVLLFGGTGYDETWVYDSDINTWTKKAPQSAPDYRWYIGMSPIWGTDKVILYGGQYNLITYNDTWIYDLSQDTWTKIQTTTDPGPRYYHAMFPLYGTDKVLLYGGWWANSNDVWVFDYSDLTWSQKKTTNELDAPYAGWYHSMAPIYKTDKAVLYGGYYYYYLDDTWIYRHSSPTRNGTFVSTAYDTGSNSTYKKLTWKAKVPANTSLKFQLRTAVNESLLNTKDFVGPDGKTSSYYTSSPINTWSGHNGDRWIQCKIFFNISFFTESLRLDEVTISYNCIPTTVALGPPDGILLANNKPLFLWTFKDYDSDVQKAFEVLIDDDIEFKNVDYNSGEQYSTNNQWQFPSGSNYTKISDGSWYWKVCTRDADGMWTEYTQPRLITIDTNVPNSVTNIPNNNGYYKTLDNISGIATDGEVGSGVTQIEISIMRQRDNYYWTGSSWAQLPTWLIASGYTKWTYNSTDVTWSTGVRYLIQSRATDNASNIEPVSGGNMFNIDMDGPVSKIESPKNSVWLNKLESISGTSYDTSGSGLIKVEISLKCTQDANLWDGDAKVNNYWDGKEWRSKETWLTAMGTEEWVYNSSKIPYSSGNEYFIRCRGVDAVGNLEVPNGGISFMFDSMQPANLSIYINNGDKYTRSNKVTLSLQAEDLESGISKMAFSTDNYEWSDWVPFSTEKNFTLSANDGEKPVYFKVKDYAGNIAEPVQGTIYLDSTAPKDLSIEINGNAKYTNSKNVKFTLYGVDAGSGIEDIAYSENGIYWKPWEPYSTTRRFMITGEDGEKIIYFKLRDNAGNIAEPASDSIIVDTAPPHSLMIIINNGASETDSGSITLNFNAVDDISRVSELSLSTDGVTWTPWENFTFFKYYTLSPGDGTKTIYFKAKDSLGNEAEPVYAGITLTSPIQEEEGSKETSYTISSVDFWIILLVIITIILLVVNLVLMLKRRRHPEGEVPYAALTIKPGQRFAPMEPSAQVAAAIKLDQLSGTVAVSASPQASVSTPTLAKSTQVSVAPGPGAVPELPALPPAIILDEKPENATAAPEPTVVTPSPSPQPTPVTPGIPTADVQPQAATPIQPQVQPQVQVQPQAQLAPVTPPGQPPQPSIADPKLSQTTNNDSN